MSSGEVIYFDGERGTGFISGTDGNRYVFDVSDLAADAALAKGAKVRFEPDGDRARRIDVQAGARRAATPAQTARPAGPRGEEAVHDAEPPVAPGLWSYFRYCVTSGYLRFEGRARRREYWSFVLVSLIGFAILGAIGFAVGTALGYDETDEPIVTGVFAGIFWLFLLLPTIAVLVRRVHDIGLAGWFVLLWFIPWVGPLIILVFTLVGSQKHENKWGPVPAGVGV